MATTRQRFEDYLESVRARLATDTRVVGLVGMGSTAERWRVDEWSDHDLAIIVTQAPKRTSGGDAPGFPTRNGW